MINKLYGKVHIHKEFIRNCTILRVGSSIIGESLLKVGAIVGQKAAVDGEVPWLIKKGTKELKTSYLKAIFDDEGCVYHGKKNNQRYITLSRYRHINNITEKQRKELEKLSKHMSSREFPTGHINKIITIKRASKLIKDNNLLSAFKILPQLLQGESLLLDELGIEHRIFNRSLSKTHLGRYSLCFDLYINRKNSLIKFYKCVGFSLERKQNKLKNIVGGINAKVL